MMLKHSRLTLGHVYDLDLKKNDKIIRDVIIQAQGEVNVFSLERVSSSDFFFQMALEEYIKQVREIWTNYTLDLFNYQNKCRLIR